MRDPRPAMGQRSDGGDSTRPPSPDQGGNVTKLLKAVKRTADVGRETLVITLYPGAVLGMRRSRTRREYTISLQTCYTLAILQEQDRIKAERKKARGRRTLAKRGLLKGGGR